MTILVEINVEGVSPKKCKKVSIYGQNYRTKQLPNSEIHWTLLRNKNLSGVI